MAGELDSGGGGGGGGGGGDGGSTEPDNSPNNITLLGSPRAFIRGVVFRPIVRAALAAAAAVISAILVVFRGSSPGFGWDEQVWGLADLPVLAGEWLFGLVIWVVSTAFTTLMEINRQLVPTIPGPLDGLLLWILLALEVTVLSHLLVRGIRAAADSVPIAASIETFIFG